VAQTVARTAPKARPWDPTRPDLRLRAVRERGQTLLDRAEHLPPPDRELIRAVFGDGRPAAELAAMLGASPRRVRTRIRQLVIRLSSPRFAFVASRLDTWRGSRRKVAQLHFLQGFTAREAADRLGLSFHTVRRHRDAIIGMMEGAGL
jgi:DNA-directed RNA polymerase specialized sigma24 family protein